MIKIVDGSLNKFLLIETLMAITKKNRTNLLINKSSGKCSDLKQSIKKKFNNFFIVTPKQKSLKSSDLCHSIMLFLYFMK